MTSSAVVGETENVMAMTKSTAMKDPMIDSLTAGLACAESPDLNTARPRFMLRFENAAG